MTEKPPVCPVLSKADPFIEKHTLEGLEKFLSYDTRSGDCFQFLLSVLETSSTAENRLLALQILLNEVRRRNTRVAMPISVTSTFTPQETEIFENFNARILKLSERAGISKFPHHLYEYSDIVSFAKTYFPPKHEKFITAQSKITTIGSCFASNVAKYLKKRGLDAWSLDIGELINNSYNNLWLLENLDGMEQKREAFWAKLQPEIYEGCLKLSERIKTSDLIIFTLGLSLAFTSESGEVLSEPIISYSKRDYQGYDLKEISVEKNTANMVKIIDLIKQINPKAKILISLSPVPLDGILDNEASVVEMDCISKSIGRVTLSALKRERSEYIYFPSYELVRWVACNQPMPLYGGDREDQEARHVTRNVVADIMTVFEAFYLVSVPKQPFRVEFSSP